MAPCMIAVDNQTLVVKPAFLSPSADLNVAKHTDIWSQSKSAREGITNA